MQISFQFISVYCHYRLQFRLPPTDFWTGRQIEIVEGVLTQQQMSLLECIAQAVSAPYRLVYRND